MGSCRVVEDWEATYQDPIVLKESEELWLTGKSENWDGYVWVWAKNQAGREGWIPDTLIKTVADRNYANSAFSALELTCHRGEELDAIDEMHGWVLCRAANGSEGWVPAKNLQEIWPAPKALR